MLTDLMPNDLVPLPSKAMGKLGKTRFVVQYRKFKSGG